MNVYDKRVVICGTDFTEAFTRTGYTVDYEVVSGGNDGTLQNGEYQEDEIARKAVIVFPVMPSTAADTKRLEQAVYNSDNPTLVYFDPLEGDYRTIATRRGKLSPARYRGIGVTGKEYWTTGSLTLREK